MCCEKNKNFQIIRHIRSKLRTFLFLTGYISVILLPLFLMGCTRTPAHYFIAPSELPNTDRTVNRPGYWIEKHPFPDRIILNATEIEKLNNFLINNLKVVRNIPLFPQTVSGKTLVSQLQEIVDTLSKRNYYGTDGRKASPFFYTLLLETMNIHAIPAEVSVRFGFITQYAHQRILPTKEGLYGKPGDTDFDELQNSALDIATPVAVLHNSSDNKWVYTVSPLSSGWIESGKIAYCDQESLKEYLVKKPFIVTTNAKNDLFCDPTLTDFYDYVRMGVTFPLVGKSPDGIYTILIPTREKNGALAIKHAYINKENVHNEYLSYSPRNMMQQSFKLLNAPYGWGGMYGEQDCSRFIQEVFSTAGIHMPRNSSDQARVGTLIAKFKSDTPIEEKHSVLNNSAIGGITLLYMKGHIMLYLGMRDNEPFAVHATWAYREKKGFSDTIRVINRVAVTDLDLGKGSRKGSFLKRLLSVRIIGKEKKPEARSQK